jgi:general secretion pathway protein L
MKHNIFQNALFNLLFIFIQTLFYVFDYLICSIRYCTKLHYINCLNFKISKILNCIQNRFATNTFIIVFYKRDNLRFVVKSAFGIAELGVINIDGSQLETTSISALAERVQQIGYPLILRLDESLGLNLIDKLPRTARKDLRKILACRLDTITPWSSDDVICEPVSVFESVNDGMLTISLVIVQKYKIRQSVEALGRLGLVPDVVDLADDDAYHAPHYCLLGNSGPTQIVKLVPIAVGISIIMSMTISLLALVELNDNTIVLNERQDHLNGIIESISDLPDIYSTFDSLRSRMKEITTEHHQNISRLWIIDQISQVIPDTSWLESISIEDRKIIITGYSTEASHIPGLIERHPNFMGVVFTAPIQRYLLSEGHNRTKNVEQFSLQFFVE